MLDLFLIAGHNGAGKSSYGKNFLPEKAQQLLIFDGDLMYYQKRQQIFSQTHRAKYASKQAEEYTVEQFESALDYAVKNRKDFAYEGHFHTEATWNPIRYLKKQGYSSDGFFGCRKPKFL